MSVGSQHWSEWIREQESRNEPYVLVTVLGARGSTPRDSGTKMVVARDGFAGTIGGGRLEFDALARARSMLSRASGGQSLENFPLSEKLGQCCGGSTSLLFECFVPDAPNLYLFGAGHVGRALAPILASLPLRVNWVDTRSDEFPDALPEGVASHSPATPADVVVAAPAKSYFVIMTHNHPLDYELMEAALRRGDAAYIGVIGSQSKWRRFRMRLAHRGYDDPSIETVRCPIGLPEVPGKRPAEIAVSVAAELIAHYYAQRDDDTTTPGPAWKALQSQLADTGILSNSPVTDTP